MGACAHSTGDQRTKDVDAVLMVAAHAATFASAVAAAAVSPPLSTGLLPFDCGMRLACISHNINFLAHPRSTAKGQRVFFWLLLWSTVPAPFCSCQFLQPHGASEICKVQRRGTIMSVSGMFDSHARSSDLGVF